MQIIPWYVCNLTVPLTVYNLYINPNCINKVKNSSESNIMLMKAIINKILNNENASENIENIINNQKESEEASSLEKNDNYKTLFENILHAFDKKFSVLINNYQYLFLVLDFIKYLDVNDIIVLFDFIVEKGNYLVSI